MSNLGLPRICVLCISLFLAVSQTVEAGGARKVRKLSRAAKQAQANTALTQRLDRSVRNARLAARNAQSWSGNAAAFRARRLDTRPLPWDPETKIREILQIAPEPRYFLPQIKELQLEYGDHGLIALTAKRYYKEHFGLLTPHLHRLFDKIGSFKIPQVEQRFLTRMQFLSDNKNLLAAKLSRTAIRPGNIRLRYLTDVGRLMPQNFNEKDLILSVEQTMSPDAGIDVPVRHVNGRGSFRAGSNIYEIYEYMGPPEFIPNLYRFLLNNDRPHDPITLVFDEEARSLAAYNHDKTLWIRVTPHEYQSPKKLHIHLNEQRKITFRDINGFEREETVNINLSIPLAIPETMPRQQPQNIQFLYEKLVLNPVKNLQADKYVTIERRPIF